MQDNRVILDAFQSILNQKIAYFAQVKHNKDEYFLCIGLESIIFLDHKNDMKVKGTQYLD